MTQISYVKDELEELIKRVLDGTTGLLKFVSISDLQADEPPLYVGMAEMIDARKVEPKRMSNKEWQTKAKKIALDNSEHLNTPSGTIHSSGAGIDRTTALWATVGEALERYAMGYFHPSDSFLSKPNELPGRYIDSSKMILFSDEQYSWQWFPYVRYDSSIERHWLTGVSLSTGEQVYLPAEFCIGNDISGNPQRLCGTYSTGCAAGPDYNWALLSGLSEAVERDSFMYYWLSRRTPLKLNLETFRSSLPKNLQKLIDYPHIDIHLAWLKTDINIPTVVCFIKAHNTTTFATGAATNVNWKVAVEKAIVESFHTLNWTVDLDRWSDEPQTKEKIKDFPDHVKFYLEPENHHYVDFLTCSDAEDGTQEFLSLYQNRILTLKEAIAALSERGLEPVAVDRTYDDLDSVGLKVVHVVVPGLHPLHVGLGIEFRDTRRLDAISKYFGLSAPETLNLNPHPFP
jgi:ribosomal protein S12 methylthiotransferase accessory factor